MEGINTKEQLIEFINAIENFVILLYSPSLHTLIK